MHSKEIIEAYFKIRWPDFKPEEILGVDQLNLYLQKGVFAYSFKALDKLQEFRNIVGAPLRINQRGLFRRGARSTKENYEVQKNSRGSDGWEYSFHLWCAFDIDSLTVSIPDLYKAAIDSKLWGGIGLYDTWIHVDDRDNLSNKPILWDLRKLK